MSAKLVCIVYVVVVLALMISSPALAVGPDPVGWWKLDETSGTIASDSSGNGHDGTVVGNPQWVGGYFGGALRFTGSPDMITVPYSAQLNPENQFTVMLWANVEPGTTYYWRIDEVNEADPNSPWKGGGMELYGSPEESL